MVKKSLLTNQNNGRTFILSIFLLFYVSSPFYVCVYFEYYIPPSSRYHTVLCKTWSTGGFLWGFMTASTYGLVCLTLDRFLKIMHPFWSQKHYTRPLRVCLLVFPWIFGPAFQIGMQIGMSAVDEGECVMTLVFDTLGKVTALSICAVEFYIPLMVIAGFYSCIIYKLRKRAATMGKYRDQGKCANLMLMFCQSATAYLNRMIVHTFCESINFMAMV